MDRVESLKIKKIIKEFDYLESDFEYRQEIVSIADKEFLNEVNSFLDINQDLKEVYDQKITDKISKTIEQLSIVHEQDEKTQTDFEDWNTEEPIVQDDQLKKLFREIVKHTHPDKINDENLNELYLKAKKVYESGDKIKLFSICSELNINFEVSQSDVEDISSEISKFRDKINFLENTYTWKWYHSGDELEKSKIILEYIHLRLI